MLKKNQSKVFALGDTSVSAGAIWQNKPPFRRICLYLNAIMSVSSKGRWAITVQHGKVIISIGLKYWNLFKIMFESTLCQHLSINVLFF